MKIANKTLNFSLKIVHLYHWVRWCDDDDDVLKSHIVDKRATMLVIIKW